jgi:hypothetical protein
MARTILPLAGAAVGLAFGMPQAGFIVGSILASAIPAKAQGPRIGETGAQTSQEGAFRAIVYAVAMVTGNVIASGTLITRDVEENQGGKGGGTDVATEHAYRTYAIRVCEGPIAGYLRIWEDDKLVYDVRPASTIVADSIQWAQGVTFYLGDETQLPSPVLEAKASGSNTPAYRGSAYVVFNERDLTDRRGSVPQYRFEVATSSTSGDPVRTEFVENLRYISGFVTATGLWGMLDMRLHGESGGPGDPTLVISYTDGVSDTTVRSIDYGPTYNGTSDWCMVNGADDPSAIQAYRSGPGQTYQVRTIDLTTGGISVIYEVIWTSGVAPPGGHIINGTRPRVAQDPVTGRFACVGGVGAGVIFKVFTPHTNIAHDGDTTGLTFNSPIAFYNGVIYALSFGSTPSVRLIDGSSGGSDGEWTSADVISGIQPGGCAIHADETGVYVLIITTSGGSIFRVSAAGWELLTDAAGFLEGGSPGDGEGVFETSNWICDGASALIGPNTTYQWTSVRFGAIVGGAVPLSDIVSDIHARCGFPMDKVDVSELEDMVTGLVLASDYSGADGIDAARKLFLFDKSDYDKVLHYPKRGKPVVATLTIDDLVEEPDTSTREQAIEFPKKLHLIYQNPDGGYASAKATSARSTPDARVVGETTVEVPVSLNADQAAQAAAKLHKISYAEAEGETKLSVPLSFIKYVPGDCFGIALRGTVVRRRMDEMEYSDGVISYTMRGDRQSAYTSDVTGIPIPTPTPPPSSIVGSTVLAFLDIASRIDSEDDLNYYVAGTGAMPAWYGYVLQRSLDGGASYANVDSFSRAAVIGSLLDAIPSASEYFTDTTNVVRVQLYRDTQVIDSITTTQFLSEGGAFALEKSDGSYEIMQYLDAADEGDNVFALSKLHRGLLNSGSSGHLAGALFVMLERAEHIPAQSAWIGQSLTHRAPSFGETPETAAVQTQTYVGRSQREWPVAYLSTSFDGTTLAATWTPRHRFGTDDAPVASINFQGYLVTITNLMQTIQFDTTVPNFSVDASAISLPFSASVAALNRITGPGEDSVEIIGGTLPPSMFRASGLEVASTADVAHQVDATIVLMGRSGASSGISFYDSETFVQVGTHGIAASEPVAAASEGDLTFCVFSLAAGAAKILRFDRSSGFTPTHALDLSDPITDICIGGGFVWASDPYNGWTLKYDIADLTLLTYVPMPSLHLASDGITVFAGGSAAGIQCLDIATMTATSFALDGPDTVERLAMADGKLIVHEGAVNAYNPSTGTKLLKLADSAGSISAAGSAIVIFGGLAEPGVVYEAITLTPMASVEDPTRDTTDVIALTDQRLLVAVNPTIADPVARAQIWIP